MPTPDPSRSHLSSTAYASALLFAVAEAVAFVSAFTSLNRHEPDRIGVLNWAIVGLVASAATLGLSIWAAGAARRTWWFLGGGAAVGLALGLFLSGDLLPSLGPAGHRLWIDREGFVLLGLALPAAALAVLLVRRRWEPAHAAAICILAFHTFFYMTLGAAMLTNLPALEAEAQRVNEAPAWNLIAVLLSTVAALALSRRALR